MTISLTIVPFADSVDMYGDVDRSAAYSLSGHVVISVSSTQSLFDYGQKHHLRLQSLVVTFEGQSELITEETGYSAVRLCTVSQECVPEEAVELTGEEQGESAAWTVVFNLNIPGWLPPTSPFGQMEGGEAGTRYALHATAKFETDMDSRSNAWLSTLCLPFRLPSRVVKARRCPVTVNRFTNPSSIASSSTSLFPLTNFAVAADPQHSAQEGDVPRVPPHILSQLRAMVSVPERVDLNEGSVPIQLRLRTEGLDDNTCKRLRVDEFTVDIEQTERYRSRPLSAYMTTFPVPPPREQPPSKPLLNPNPIHTIYDLDITRPLPNQVLTRTFSVVPESVSGRYIIAGDGYIFSEEDSSSDEITWFSMETSIPFSNDLDTDADTKLDWKSRRTLRQSGQGPLFGVQHKLHMSLRCTYDLDECDETGAPRRATERLTFHIPIRFVRIAPTAPLLPRLTTPAPSGRYTPSLTEESGPSSSRCSSATSSMFPVPSLPYANTLPAYSQLFDSNGDRKIDYSIPLPVYTPRPTDAKESSPSSDSPPGDGFEDIPLSTV
ncbi:hypothetical protein K474DRAFT_1704623 [Panus rudis PR-1116 ss-1]|nr:hypothetical protein K474DRAFT_1704623 [Panus rudis PR-1116 ss-1]